MILMSYWMDSGTDSLKEKPSKNIRHKKETDTGEKNDLGKETRFKLKKNNEYKNTRNI